MSKILIDRSVVEQALEAFDVATTPLARDRQEVLWAQAALSAALEQPQVEQEPVAEVTVSHVLPDLEGRCTAEIASCERLPVGAELFIHPQNLRCKSNQARLATLWGYVKPQPKREQEPVAWMHQCNKRPDLAELSFSKREPALAAKGYRVRPLIFGDIAHPQPKRKPLTDEHLKAIINTIDRDEQYIQPALRQLARAIERAHGIGGEA